MLQLERPNMGIAIDRANEDFLLQLKQCVRVTDITTEINCVIHCAICFPDNCKRNINFPPIHDMVASSQQHC